MGRRDDLVKRKRVNRKRIVESIPAHKTAKRKGPKRIGRNKNKQKQVVYTDPPHVYPPLKPDSKFAIVVKSHARKMAKVLDYDVVRYLPDQMKHYDGIIYIGPYYYDMLRTMFSFHKRYPDVRIVIWWVGTDVLRAIQPGYNAPAVKNLAFKHICVSRGLQRDLKSVGIPAEIVTMIPEVHKYRKCPLPTGRYTVAVYMPSTKTVYRWADCKRIMEKTPYINYIIYGNKGPMSGLPDNANAVGWVEDTSRQVFKKCHCLLRLTTHDGFPQSIIEASLMGRAVITNHDYPHVFQSNNVNEIVEIIKNHPEINDDVIKYYRAEYTEDRLKKQVEALWDRK